MNVLILQIAILLHARLTASCFFGVQFLAEHRIAVSRFNVVLWQLPTPASQNFKNLVISDLADTHMLISMLTL